ncbi:unnamed protein product [Adineta steineri]|uniref:Uncharacterized protein n=1 Tax=Adineta steineri TaxID=433720 RepID=A0A815HQ44_9BILA|nr:unnamed protein product [Adineta steineri]CAF1599028.1 unnamed protein product [Adineta steineri]
MLNQNIDSDEQWCQWLRFQPCEYVIQNSFDNTLSLDPLVRMVHQGINSCNDENDKNLVLKYPALRLL